MGIYGRFEPENERLGAHSDRKFTVRRTRADCAQRQSGGTRVIGAKEKPTLDDGVATGRRILFVQFTDPAAYPPLEHASGIFADRGWNIVFLGAEAFGVQQLRLPNHRRVQVKKLAAAKTRIGQRLQYFTFFFWTLYWTWAWKPDWIYGSDPFSLPILWAVRKLTKARVVYHEHDSPNFDKARSWFMRAVIACRERLGSEVELCVIPQHERLLEFLKATRRDRPTLCVWNCPRISEVQDIPSSSGPELVLYYHGSINSCRVPTQLIVAAARFKGAVRLQVAGYESAGNIGYIGKLMRLAAEKQAPGLIEFLGAIPFRKDLLRSASKAHIGVSFVPKAADDFNLRYMVGASNKPFDCMACGLPLLVSHLPDWISTFVEPGYARACDPDDPDSIEAELRWYLEHPDERREMGRRCREKIPRDWNYETLFAPVVTLVESA